MSQAPFSLVTMNDPDNNPNNNIATLATDSRPESSFSAGFDPAQVFTDPVGYLERFGLRSELIETKARGFRAAA